MTHEPDASPLADDTACARYEERLMAYLERELRVPDRHWMDAHRATCARCDTVARDIESLVQQAGILPAFAPSRDLWSGIAERLDTPVVPLVATSAASQGAPPLPVVPERSRPRAWSPRWLAVAATVLVTVTSAITWRLASSRDAGGRTDASARTAVAGGRGSPSADSQDATASFIPVAQASEVYEAEIVALRAIVDARFSELDTSTVAILRRNLEIIDRAIADSRKALEQDPNSRALSTALDRALQGKLALMRRVALL